MPAPPPAERQQLLTQLAALSAEELAQVWAGLNLTASATSETLADVLLALVSEYGSAAAFLAAEWFDEARDTAGAPGPFTALLASPPTPERIDVLAGWGLSPLERGDPDSRLALSRLSGGLQRLVVNMARDTTEGSVTLDPSGPRFARHASANACGFCRMLATRGADYTSEDAALRVVGRGTDVATNVGRTSGRRAKGIRSRGSRALGEKYHDYCRCVAIEVWPEQQYEEAPYVKQWREQYASAVTTGGRYGAIDVKQTLAAWREQFDVR